MTKWGKQRIRLVEIDQPFCSRTYGLAPCTAVLGTTGNYKCHNTRKTCQDPANYLPGVDQSVVTISVASPAVVTWADHGLKANTPVTFETTGALPTGLTPGTQYFVKDPLEDSFNVSATINGGAINTSGTQSGVHTAIAETPLTLRLSENLDNVIQYGPVIPVIKNINVTPAAINLGGMDRSRSALGQRETAAIDLANCLDADVLVDKYRSERITGDASLFFSGDAQAGSANTLTLDVDDSTDALGKQLRLIAGAGSVQRRTVAVFDSSTKIATVVPRWASNQLVNSGNYLGAGWALQNNAAIVQTQTAPDGTTTAWLLSGDSVEPLANGAIFQSVTLLGSTTYVGSLHVKAGSVDTLAFGLRDSVAAVWRSLLNINLTTGVITDSGIGGGAFSIELIGAGWFRVNFVVQTSANTAYTFYTYPKSSGVNSAADNIAIWHPQLEPHDQLGEYIESGAAAIALPDSSTDYELRDAYDPYKRGSLWGKWLARNPFYPEYPIRLYEGYEDDLISEMTVRHYLMDRVDGPNKNGIVIRAKDLFSKIESRKAVAPKASKGELQAGITSGSTSFVLIPSGIGAEYLAAGHVNIGDEIIQYTRVGDTFTVVLRGALNTTAAAHDAEDLVQQVLQYTSQLAHDIVYDLLINYSGVSAALIDKAQWDVDASALTELYTTRIARPEQVNQLIAELSEQAGFTVYPDVFTGMVKFVPFRAAAPIKTLTDETDIVEESVFPINQDVKRASQIWFYYAQINPVEDLDDERNYRSRIVEVDLEAESKHLYGTPSIKIIYSRWVPQFGRSFAENSAERILQQFRNPPIEISLELRHGVSETLALAKYVGINSDQLETEIGSPKLLTYAVTQIEPGDDVDSAKFQQVSFGETPTGDREIFIENDVTNVIVRTIHDTLYSPAVDGTVIRIYVNTGVQITSTSSTIAAFDTGTWPVGVILHLEINGHIKGAGGRGGNGGSGFFSGFPPPKAGAGGAGSAGGTALKVQHAITIDNTNGHIWGGGGGGGGGAGAAAHLEDNDDEGIFQQAFQSAAGGSAGGGGYGGAPTGSPGSGSKQIGTIGGAVNGVSGSAGTTTSAGGGGAAQNHTQPSRTSATGGAGASGGGPGTAGGTGGTSSASATGNNPEDNPFTATAGGGGGGAAGKAVDGDAFITWTAVGDRLGPIV